MKEISYKCDRCGCVLNDGAAKKTRNFCLFTEIRYRMRFFKTWRNGEPLITEYELCEKCRESLERWLNNEKT